MAQPDERLERQLETYSQEVQAALGAQIVCLAVYGSAAGDDYFDPHSDVNLAIVVQDVTSEVLEALAPVVMRWERRHFAIPLVIERAFLDRARDVFPMELDDIRRQHRLLAGTDVLDDVVVERDALRRQCEKEARGELGPLPLMSRLLDHREGVTRLVPRAERLEFRQYLGEVERIVHALDTLDA